MKEASQNLGGWLYRTMDGEQIAIHEEGCTVLLQPLPARPESPDSERLSPRKTLRLMKEESRLTPEQDVNG